VTQLVVRPERAVARRLGQRWNFERSRRRPDNGDAHSTTLPSFPWPGYGRRQPEQVTPEELRKLEIYCFANCASEMVPVKARGENGIPTPWIESYGNEMDIVARLGVLANVTGPGSVSIGGDRYQCDAACGHLLNAHYLFPMMEACKSGDSAGGLVPLNGSRPSKPRLFDYLNAKSPPLHRPG
jgi:hypothetical protein